MGSINLTQIIMALLSLLFAYLTKVVVPLINQKIKEMERNGQKDKVEAIKTAVDIGTYSAEQLYDRFHWEEKLSHAMDVATKELQKRNIEIDLAELRNYVEASVRELRILQGGAKEETDGGATELMEIERQLNQE